MLESRLLPATLFGLTAPNTLIQFDSAAPGTITNSVAIAPLTAGETVIGIDFRPATGQLYGVTLQNRLYTINTATGAATFVANLTPDPTDATNPFATFFGVQFGADFNPVADRLRVVTDIGQNVRINPDTGTVITDSLLDYPTGDPNAAAVPHIVGAAYTNNFPGATATTLLVIDSGIDILANQNPPNDGTLNTVGALGVDTTDFVGFDITGSLTPTAFASLTELAGVSSGLYTVDTASGAATLVGTIGPAGTFLRELAAPPEADLSITKTDSPDPVQTGDVLTYTITVTNNGPDAVAANTVVTDTLPAGVTFLTATPSDASDTCTETAGVVTCNLGNITSGAPETVTIEVTPTTPGTITNTATVTSSSADSNTANNTDTETTTVNAAPPVADVSVTKTDSPDPALTGQSLTYTLEVNNAGPDEATAVTVTDELPADVLFVSATPSDAADSCTQTGTTVTCDLGTIASGASETVTIVVTPTTPGTITNTATVTASTDDNDTTNNTDTETTTVNAAPPVADVSVTKTDSPDPALTGQSLTYTLEVNNAGPDEATAVTVTDELPADVLFVSATPSDAADSCTQTGTTVTCDLGTIASGASETVTIVVTPTTPGTITNTATVTSSTDDNDTTNNSDTETTTVNAAPPVADVSVTKTDSPDPALTGQSLTYTLEVNNAGPDEATAVTVTDELPADVLFVSATPSDAADSCTQTGTTVTCDLGTIASGASETVTIVVTPTTPGTITNTATVTSSTDDNDTTNNSDTETTTVNAAPPVADVSVTKTDSPDPALTGQSLTYTLEVNNAGPDEATAVTVTDELPADVLFVSATPSDAADSCTQTGTTVTCDLGTIASGASETVTIVVTPTTPGTITNTATVTSSTDDNDTTNNTDTETTTVNAAPPVADVSVTKTDSPDPALTGQSLTYTLEVNNAGPDEATAVTVTDELPADVLFVSATPSDTADSCTQTGTTVTCDLGTIASGASETVTIVVTPTTPGTITNTATVTSSTDDNDTTNNTDTETTTVNAAPPVADVSVTKTDSPDPALTGQSLTYTLEVNNAGPDEATAVTVTDELPADVLFVSATPSDTADSCTQTGTTVTCDLGTIASGASETVTIVVTPTTPGTITNTATVTASSDDNDTTNNTDTETTTVNAAPPVADVSVTKTDSPDPALTGQSLTYTLEVNNAGPDEATAVTVTDELPADVLFISATPSDAADSCTQTGTTVTCDLGTIASGASETVTIVVMPTTPGTITNTATVTASSDDNDTANNSDTESTTVNAAPAGTVADVSVTKTDSPDPVLTGQSLTYTLQVNNAGPNAATDVTVSDTLPAGVLFNSATPSDAADSCTRTGTIVTCDLGTIASGASETVTILVRPTTPGTITDTATVTTSSGDNNTGNNTDTESTTVNGEPLVDVSVTKTDSPDPVLTGQSLTYTLAVNNAGPNAATAVTVTDALPAGVLFISATPSQATDSCTRTGTILTCDLGIIASGASETVTIVVMPTTPGTIADTATVTTSSNDDDTANDADTESTTVNAAPAGTVADVSVTKTDSPDPVLTGQSLTYTLAVNNAGPNAATAVTVTDALPAGVQFISATPSQAADSCTRTGTILTCDLGTIASGASETVTIVVMPTTPGTIADTATVTTSSGDNNTANNTDTESTTVNAAPAGTVADVSVTKTDSPDPVLTGQRLTYTLAVNNAGPNAATAVTVTDALPAGVLFISATPSQVADSCTRTGTIVTCALGTIASGASETVTIVVMPTTPGTIADTATVTTSSGDNNTANNADTELTTANAAPAGTVADVSVAKTDSPDPVVAGQNLTYTLTVVNSGPNAANTVTVSDTLPPGAAFVSATPSQVADTCTQAAGLVTCNLGTIASASNETVTIVVTPSTAGTITNTAVVTTASGDNSTTNNTDTEATTVNAQAVADLAITKNDSPDPVQANQNLTYTVQVNNAGPNAANNVTVTDTLPAGVTFVSATPAQVADTCTQSGGVVTCNLGTIAASASDTVTIVVTPTASGTISNTASVTTSSGDNNTANNSDTETTTVNPAVVTADLAVTKIDSPDEVDPGSDIVYTITVSNAGTGAAQNVAFSDTLPADTTFVSLTQTSGPTFDCTAPAFGGTGTVNCTIATLAANATATFELVTNVDSNATPASTISNSVTVSSTTSDPVLNNNSDTETTQVSDQGGGGGGGEGRCTADDLGSGEGSGNVTAKVSQGKLLIRGDGKANNILIEAGRREGSLRISGRDNTTVNGGTREVELRDFEDVTIAMGAGSDVVAIVDALLEQGLRVKMQSQDDDLILCGVEVQGTARTGAGLGKDTLSVDDSIFHDDTHLGIGRGEDDIQIERHGKKNGPRTDFKKKLKIRTEEGNDKIKIGKNGDEGNSVKVDGCTEVLGGKGHDTFDAKHDGNKNKFDCGPNLKSIEENH